MEKKENKALYATKEFKTNKIYTKGEKVQEIDAICVRLERDGLAKRKKAKE